jgi:hypothetical protein
MISFAVIFNYDRLLEEVRQFWNLPVCHFGGTAGWRRSHRRNALCPGVILGVLVTVTPHVTESLIKSLKLQLSLKARANQVVKV